MVSVTEPRQRGLRPVEALPLMAAPTEGGGCPSGHGANRNPDRQSGRTGRGNDANRPVSLGQQAGLHRIAVLDHVRSPDDRQLAPACPIDAAIGTKHGLEPLFVERHIGLGVAQELLQLRALVGQYLTGRPELALHQHVEEFVLQVARLGHGRTRADLSRGRKPGAWGRRSRPQAHGSAGGSVRLRA